MSEPTATRGRYYGKYRGTVLNNVDPEQRGRIMAMVPDVLGPMPSSWAMPCLPVAGLQSGMYVLPHIGAGVWIEFEQGDPDYPIWAGGFWGTAAEVPALALAGLPASPSMVLQTPMQNTIAISDVLGGAGGIILKSATGATITVNETGILIQNGQGASILLGGSMVVINNGALTVQ